MDVDFAMYMADMTYKVVSNRIRKPFLSWKEKCVQTIIPHVVNTVVVKPFLRLGIRSIIVEKTGHSSEYIKNIVKKYREGYSVIIIPSHPTIRRHTLGMMYHCMKLSEQISGKIPHVVLATDEITFVYIKIQFFNNLVQRLYNFIGTVGRHIMLNRSDPNSSFRAGIDIARLLRDQSIVVMAGEGYPRHDSRKYVDIPNSVESFYTKLKNKNMVPASVDKSQFVSGLVREIQDLIDREDRSAYRIGKLSDQVTEHIRQIFIENIPNGYSLDVEDVVDELLMSWGERFGALQGIDPVLGVTVQPRHKALVLPVVFTEYGKKRLHIDIRDFFLIDGVSYTEVKTSLRDMERIQRCYLAIEMLEDQEHSRIIEELCHFTGIVYTPNLPTFEEYHIGKFPFQQLWKILDEKIKSPSDLPERLQSETYRDYLSNFKIAAEIAVLDKEDRALLQEAIKLNRVDVEHVIPSTRIRQAWKGQEIPVTPAHLTKADLTL
jgi:hypothetical protein